MIENRKMTWRLKLSNLLLVRLFAQHCRKAVHNHVMTSCYLAGDIGSKEVENFIDEALRMSDFTHENVLRLLGVCIDNDKDLPLVVLPFMRHGDLLTYLRADEHVCTVLPSFLSSTSGLFYLQRSFRLFVYM